MMNIPTNTTNANLTQLTANEISNIKAMALETIEACKKFDEEMKRSFLAFEIDFEIRNRLSLFYTTAFLEAVVEMDERRADFYEEDFQKELDNLDYVCENKPAVFADSFTRMRALQEFKMALTNLARCFGFEEE